MFRPRQGWPASLAVATFLDVPLQLRRERLRWIRDDHEIDVFCGPELLPGRAHQYGTRDIADDDEHLVHVAEILGEMIQALNVSHSSLHESEARFVS